MQSKDKDDGIEDSPLDMLLVILLEGASKVVVGVTPSLVGDDFFVVVCSPFSLQQEHLCRRKNVKLGVLVK